MPAIQGLTALARLWDTRSGSSIHLARVRQAGEACDVPSREWRSIEWRNQEGQTLSITDTVTRARLRLLELHHKANVGHLGGNFSCIDTLITLYHEAMRPGDDLVLSKGHAAGALYVSLWTIGRVSDESLETFAQDGSTLSGHPSAASLPEILFSTGSLGHGPALAAGLALAARHRNTGKRVYCLCSDGEWQEGSCWESLIFATHQQLDKLVFLIDQNGWQGFGRTKDVVSFEDLAPRIAAFGARVISVDGHDPEAITRALGTSGDGRPLVVVLRTRKGHGLHFEDTLESHYLPLTDAQYADARAAIQRGIAR